LVPLQVLPPDGERFFRGSFLFPAPPHYTPAEVISADRKEFALYFWTLAKDPSEHPLYWSRHPPRFRLPPLPADSFLSGILFTLPHDGKILPDGKCDDLSRYRGAGKSLAPSSLVLSPFPLSTSPEEEKRRLDFYS